VLPPERGPRVARPGLHEAAARAAAGDGAGAPDAALPLELHGSLFRVKCTRCAHRAPDRGAIDAASPASLPRCPACAALLRPDVVWFGESLDPEVLERAFALAEAADVCLVAGTSAVVHPAASLPVTTARAGGRVIEVNPEPTPLTPLAAVAVRGGSAVILPELLAS
jgi:NAD-dependent deacetylase